MRVTLKSFIGTGLLVLSGCGERPQIREYVLQPEQERIITSDVLRNQFPVIPFRWKVPEEWRSAANDQFSVVAWAAGPKDTPDEARITLSDLPRTAGLETQIQRWRGQIGLAQASEPELMQGTEQLALTGGTGTWVELQGSRETILGMIVTLDDKLWVLKYRSTNQTADQQRKALRAFCESLRIEKPRRS